MDIDFKIIRKCPKSTFLSGLLFLWVYPYYKKVLRGGVQLSDVYLSPNEFSSKKLGDELERIWINHLEYSKKKNKKPSILKMLAKMFFWEYLVYAFYLVLEMVVFRSLGAVILSRFIGLFQDESVDNYLQKYMIATIYWILIMFAVMFSILCRHNLDTVGLKASVAISSLLYRKMLKLNQASLGKTSCGQIVNILSNDLNRVEFFVRYSCNVITSPIHFILMCCILWQEVGISCLAGIIFFLVIALPTQVCIGILATKLCANVAINSDKRTKVINEIVSGIKVIKMYTWEKPFEILVRAVRYKELQNVYRSFIFCGSPYQVHALLSRSSVFFVLLCAYLISEDITTATTFALMQYMNLIRNSTLVLFPWGVTSIAEAIVSFKRIEHFMLQEEITNYVEKESTKKVCLNNIHAYWNPNSLKLRIQKFEIPNGKFCTIIGPVGSGKSSLLQILLGELKPHLGEVKLTNSVSYCSQEPWLFCSSVRNNILFGQEYKEERYKKIVHICNLYKDFESFPHGDLTLVGEKGVILSGGQKARINLARALYKDTDLYLLDDPLSAVDTHVGRHLFDQCFLKFLNGKTRILVTHQLQYLKDADIIYVMKNGEIEASGSFEELSKSNLNLTMLLSKMENENIDHVPKDFNSPHNELHMENYIELKEQEVIPKDINSFVGYITAGGNKFFILILILITVSAQVSYNLSDYWLLLWRQSKNKELEIKIINLNHTNENTPLYGLENTLTKYANFSSYCWIMLVALILTIVRIDITSRFIWKASYNLHEGMFHFLLKAPLKFFNYHPSGRILNKFSKDIGTTDQLLPTAFLEASQIMLYCAGSMVLICFTNYYVIIFVGIFFIFLIIMFMASVKLIMQVKHLEGITKSPVFTHINYSLTGLTTIRSDKSEKKLIEQFDIHQDIHTSVYYLLLGSYHSSLVWMDYVCTALNAAIPYTLILANQYGYPVHNYNIGLAMSQATALSGILAFGSKRCSEACSNLASVARILSYTKLEEEPLETSKDSSLTKAWPSTGKIEFKNLHLKYSKDGDAVLKNLSFLISPNQKIGVVGRTGAGKSSLITALFRLADIEGTIMIDNVNISEIGLTKLRRNISIIPQEPVLFSETIRYNLDPFHEFDDDKIWNVIEEVNMKDAINGLDYMVFEGGSNFSIGQKQLLCLARALLRRNKILVLDEATANVDLRTDEFIQNTIKNKFESCTVITIAHRLNTIMDSDKVMVMNGGELVEFDHPYILLENNKSMFYNLVLETGVSMMHELRQIAYKDYHLKNNKTNI